MSRLMLSAIFLLFFVHYIRARRITNKYGQIVFSPRELVLQSQFPQKFDPQPIEVQVTPVKRSAMLINKLMRDLQRALGSDQHRQGQESANGQNGANDELASKRKIYSRCYLNAASCFI
ncbi:hypothetical protein HDE_02543 [Halotydeus destructor]|nr:hypothetical protein HDE_02543 [Halotydeus destructor]